MESVDGFDLADSVPALTTPHDRRALSLSVLTEFTPVIRITDSIDVHGLYIISLPELAR